MNEQILIYGANGYTAELIIAQACREGARPVLAGRSADKLRPLAERFGLPMRAFALDDPDEVARHLQDIRVVLNCAGPYLHTAAPMAAACIRLGVHYLDLNGEIGVFERLAALGPVAKAAGVMLMPGVGFDIVPSDCLAAHMKRRLPEATLLTLNIQAIGRPSHGTTLTILESQVQGAICKGGKIVSVPPVWKTKVADCGHGPVKLTSFPWGDVSSAYHSTGIPGIEVYFAVPNSFYTHLVLADYNGEELPSPQYACPEDATLLAWQSDPANFNNLGVPSPAPPGKLANDNKRWPYMSSYGVPTHAWSQDDPYDIFDHRVSVFEGASRLVTYGTHHESTIDHGNRRYDEVAYPAAKVHFADRGARHFTPRAVYWGFADQKQPVLYFDGVVRTTRTGAANPGWDWNNPDSQFSSHAYLVNFATPNFAWYPGSPSGDLRTYAFSASFWACTRTVVGAGVTTCTIP